MFDESVLKQVNTLIRNAQVALKFHLVEILMTSESWAVSVKNFISVLPAAGVRGSKNIARESV